MYRLKEYLEVYLLIDADHYKLIIIGDRTHGFIPAFIYSQSSRDNLDGTPGNPRWNAFFHAIEAIKNNLQQLMEAFELHNDDWYALQNLLPKLLKYSA